MASLGVTVLPKDDSLQRAIAGVMSDWQQRRSQDATRAQQQSQFERTQAGEDERTKSLVGTNAANVENARATTLDARAKDIATGFFATAESLRKKGATPDKIQEFVVDGMRNFADETPGPDGAEKPPALKELYSLVRQRIVTELTKQPDTPGDQQTRNSLTFGADAAGRAAAGGTKPEDISLARRVATGESSPVAEFADLQQREAGPAQHSRFVKVEGKLAPTADQELVSRTAVQTTGMQNASAERIARLRDENDRAIAELKATRGEPTTESADQKQKRLLRIQASVNDLMGNVRSNTVGFFGSIFAKAGGTPAADFAADLNLLKSNVAFKELQEMRDASKTGGALGSVAIRELEMLESTLGSLDTKQSPANFKKNLALVGADIADSLDRWHEAKGSGGDKTVTRAELERMGSTADEAEAEGYTVVDQ